jgi:hypothetical protein|tara:strand:+ start:1438 stop:1848 length:411 start_codon:yes stop_codon:yes gene_type:complete
MRILYTNDEGGVSVVVPAPSWTGTMEELAAKVVPENEPYKIVEDSVVPTDRTFRGAWENYEAINVNFSKAQTITKERLRGERKPLLEEQDILFMRAVETSQDKSDIVAEKQRLRDITLSVDTAVDLDELKGLNVNG